MPRSVQLSSSSLSDKAPSLNAWGEPVPAIAAQEAPIDYMKHYEDEEDYDTYGQSYEIMIEDSDISSSPFSPRSASLGVSPSPRQPRGQEYSTHVVSDILSTLPLHQLDSFAKFRPGAIVSSALFSLQYQRMKLAASVKYMDYQEGRSSIGRPHPLRSEVVA